MYSMMFYMFVFVCLAFHACCTEYRTFSIKNLDVPEVLEKFDIKISFINDRVDIFDNINNVYIADKQKCINDILLTNIEDDVLIRIKRYNIQHSRFFIIQKIIESLVVSEKCSDNLILYCVKKVLSNDYFVKIDRISLFKRIIKLYNDLIENKYSLHLKKYNSFISFDITKCIDKYKMYALRYCIKFAEKNDNFEIPQNISSNFWVLVSLIRCENKSQQNNMYLEEQYSKCITTSNTRCSCSKQVC